MGKDGVGTAIVDYGSAGVFSDAKYSVDADGAVVVYLGDLLIGRFTYSAQRNTLNGALYIAATSSYNNAAMYLFDDFRGVWISDNVIKNIEFNGLGNYNVPGNINQMTVRGTITVDGVAAGSYTLENSTLTGSFEYDGNNYSIVYDEKTNRISVNGGAFYFVGPDKWLNIKLTDGNRVYSFNGRGNLSSGEVTVTDASGNIVSTSGYTVSGDNITIAGLGTITKTGNEYKLGGQTFSIYNPFTGKWFVARATAGEPYIEVNNVDANFEATGKVFGQAVKFTYHTVGNYMTFDDSGVTYYLFAMTSEGVTELAFAMSASMSDGYVTCVLDGSFDSLMGTYTAHDGGYITFDGLGNGKFINGTATQYDKNNKVVREYSYTFNRFGLPVLTSGRSWLFVECDGNDIKAFANTAGDKYYKLFTPNDLYLVRTYGVMQGDNKVVADKSVTYLFDGIDKVECSDGKTYTYSPIIADDVRMEYYLTLKDDEGKEYYAVLTYGTEDMTLSLDLNLVKAYGVTASEKGLTVNKRVEYSFDGENIEVSNGLKYTYKILSFDKTNKMFVLSITEENGKEQIAVLNYGVADKTLTVLSSLPVYGVKVEENNIVADKNVSYSFDGKNVTTGGTVYSFVITGFDKDNKLIFLSLTGTDGKLHTAVLDYSADVTLNLDFKFVKVYGVRVSNGNVVTYRDISYSFDGANITCSDGSMFTYTVLRFDEENKLYYLDMTDSRDGKTFTAIFNYNTAEKTLIFLHGTGLMTGSGETVYTFDGKNIVFAGGVVYSYEIVSYDKDTNVFILNFKDGAKTQNAVYDYGNGKLIMLSTFTAYGEKVVNGETVADKEVSYSFGDGTVFGGNTVTVNGIVCEYEVVSYNVYVEKENGKDVTVYVYGLRITNGDSVYTGVLKNYGAGAADVTFVFAN